MQAWLALLAMLGTMNILLAIREVQAIANEKRSARPTDAPIPARGFGSDVPDAPPWLGPGSEDVTERDLAAHSAFPTRQPQVFSLHDACPNPVRVPPSAVPVSIPWKASRVRIPTAMPVSIPRKARP